MKKKGEGLSAYARYQIINRSLLNGRKVKKVEILDACERISDSRPANRTFEQDLFNMRHNRGLGFFAPIKYAQLYYFYTDPSYTIDNRAISDEEIEALALTAKLLEKYKDLELFRTFSGTAQRLIDTVSIFQRNNSNSLQDKVEVENITYSKGREHMENIFHCLANEIPLKIQHQSFSSEKSHENIVHPIYLKEYSNRWYLVAYNETYKAIRTYGLDRIISIEKLKYHKFIPTQFDAKEYYKNIVGVSVIDRKPFKIQLAFTKFQSKYLITQPLHHSQTIISETKDEVVFEYFLIPTFEFDSRILGWNDQVRVLSPEEYKNEIIQKLQRTLKRY